MPFTDEDLELRMGRLLRIGVLLAGGIVALGAILYLVRHGAQTVDYRHFRSESPDLRTLAGVWRGVLSLHAAAVIQLGIMLMIATPVLRVAYAVCGFARRRDWLYTGISALVLGLLVYALAGAA